MHKALYPIVADIVRTRRVQGSFSACARDLQLDIRRRLCGKRLKREVSQRDIIMASQIVLKKWQEADSNMCVVLSSRNFYEIKEHVIMKGKKGNAHAFK